MGLIEGLLHPLSAGYPAVLMAPVAFLQRPLRWLSAISRYRATCSGGPNFAYDLCVQKITPAQRTELDLSSWRMAYTGSEPVRRSTLEAFHAAFAPSGFRWEAFRPCYGLAEATLLVSSGRRGDAPRSLDVDAERLARDCVVPTGTSDRRATTVISCGPLSCHTSVVIVDPATGRQRSPNEVGEIWISSPSVTRGYWRKSTRDPWPFGARLADTAEGPFLRTGDLGFMRDGELFVTGRLKDVIIVRGRKHYPQDIEAAVEGSHPALRPAGAAAFACEVAGRERLIVLAELDRRRLSDRLGADLQDVMACIRGAVSDQLDLQVQTVALVPLGELPKTSSGKLRRHACRTAFREATLTVLVQWDAP
jgi:acyl-CoA synthetase (AMP-forming)/AMP-acid ligase II